MRQMARCFTPSRTREEDLTEETEVDSDETDMVCRPESTTPLLARHQEDAKGVRQKGEPFYQTKSPKQPDRMRVL